MPAPQLLVGNIFSYGDSLRTMDSLYNWHSKYTQLKNFIDIDGDGIEELYGFYGDTLQIFDVVPTPITTFHIYRGVNLISIPYVPHDRSVSSLFPFITGSAYWYNPVTGLYEADSILEPGRAYFIVSPIETYFSIAGDSVNSFDIELHPGWNMVGSFSQRTSLPVYTSLTGVLSPLYFYSGATGTYETARQISPSSGYWVFCTDSLNITVSYSDTMALLKSGGYTNSFPPPPPYALTALDESNVPRSAFISVSPNPFNSSVKITAPMEVKIAIYDLRGNIVGSKPASTVLATDTKTGNAGVAPTNCTFIWRPDQSISSGIYLVRAIEPTTKALCIKRVVYLK